MGIFIGFGKYKENVHNKYEEVHGNRITLTSFKF